MHVRGDFVNLFEGRASVTL